MSRQFADPRAFCCLVEYAQDLRVRPRQPPKLNRRCEQPISISGKPCRLFPRFQDCQQFTVHAHPFLRVDCFHVIDLLTDNSAFNPQLAVKPIHVAPFQSQAFTDSQAETHTEESHRAEWFLKMLHKLSELIHRQTARLMSALRRSFDHYKVNRISRNLQRTAPHANSMSRCNMPRKYHGSCAEIGCLNQAYNAGIDPAGGQIAAAKITAAGNPASGNPMVPCGTCGYVLTKAGVSY